MVNSSETISLLSQLGSLSPHCHNACEQVATRAVRVEGSALVYREMMTRSNDPVGEITAHAKSGKSPCKGMTVGIACRGMRMGLTK